MRKGRGKGPVKADAEEVKTQPTNKEAEVEEAEAPEEEFDEELEAGDDIDDSLEDIQGKQPAKRAIAEVAGNFKLSDEQRQEVEKKTKRMARIMVHEQENWDKNNDLQITDPSTGIQYRIKRGYEVDVPIGVLNNLKESVIEKLEKDADGNERFRSINRFAFSVLKEYDQVIE